MKMHQHEKNTINITLSIPKPLVQRMHKWITRGQISKFTASAVEKALNDLEDKLEKQLESAYEAASQDKIREEEAKDWVNADINDIQDWEWYDEK